jgi:hypothetical protein
VTFSSLTPNNDYEFAFSFRPRSLFIIYISTGARNNDCNNWHTHALKHDLSEAIWPKFRPIAMAYLASTFIHFFGNTASEEFWFYFLKSSGSVVATFEH